MLIVFFLTLVFGLDRNVQAPLEPRDFVEIEEEGLALLQQRAGKFDPPCDLTVERGICLYGGRKVLTRSAAPAGLISRITFDDDMPYDSSGFGNHATPGFNAAMGRHGIGFSARFDSQDTLEISPSPTITSLKNQFALSFWILMLPSLEATKRECAIIWRGPLLGAALSDKAQYHFLLGHHLSNGRISLRMDYTRPKFELLSRGRLRPGTWTHLALNVNAKDLSKEGIVELYINGVLDQQQAFYVGALPDGKDLTGVRVGTLGSSGAATPTITKDTARAELQTPFLIDELRVWNRSLTTAEVGAESFPANGALRPTFTTFACQDSECTCLDAVTACRQRDGHLCSKLELQAGARQLAINVGWIEIDTPVWEAAKNGKCPADATTNEVKRLPGLCCYDS